MLQLLQVTLILPLLFLKVIGENEATRLLRKVRKLSGKHFGDSFEYVKYSDMIKRTNNEQLFFTVEMIGLALKINWQLAQKKKSRRKVLHWLLISLSIVIVLTFSVLTVINSSYLGWNYSDPETAALGVALHSLEWLFVRIAPIVFIGSIIGAFLTRKKM